MCSPAIERKCVFLQEVVMRTDFSEIRPNFLPEQARLEAERCLYCYDAPCKEGCPAGIDIPHFIQSIRSGNLKRAARLINKENPFGSVCGRVCPVERLCEAKCTARKIGGKSIQIGMLQRFAMDHAGFTPPSVERTGYKVAVVGSGPAGLTCARELARAGYHVTVFESKGVAGGMVALGVPEYRCPHEVTAREVETIKSEGVEIRTATPVNQAVSQLFDLGYKAIFVGVGMTKSYRPRLSGMNLKGVYMGLDFLNRIGIGDTPEVGRRVVVVGGGDTALDCARSALRLGAEEATLMYRRSVIELPADQEEIEQALEEGVIFRTLTQPVALHGDDKGILRAVEAVTVKLGRPDETGRRRPVEIKGSNFRVACNTIIFAIGTEPSNLLKRLLPKAEYVNDRFLKIDPETSMTSIPGVFAGGDVVNAGATVVQAVAEGKAAAKGMIEYLHILREEMDEEEEIAGMAAEAKEEVKKEAETVEEPEEKDEPPKTEEPEGEPSTEEKKDEEDEDELDVEIEEEEDLDVEIEDENDEATDEEEVEDELDIEVEDEDEAEEDKEDVDEDLDLEIEEDETPEEPEKKEPHDAETEIAQKREELKKKWKKKLIEKKKEITGSDDGEPSDDEDEKESPKEEKQS